MSTLETQVDDFVHAYDSAYERAAQSIGLSGAQACVLERVDTGLRSMGELAVELLCDASNVTQLVTRLESRGLVTRAPDPADRRVKRVAITAEGRAARRRFGRAFDFATTRTARLSAGERDQLSVLLARMLDPGNA